MDAEDVWVDLDRLKFGLSPRRRGVDRAHAAALAELEGGWPPILVFREDHRVIDGAMAARYLATVKDLLEKPATLLV